MPSLRLAVDTNLLLDWAGGVESVLDALDLLESRLPDADKLVSPGVLDEVAYLAEAGMTADVRESAQTVMRLLREENRFRPLLELPFSPERVDIIAGDIRVRRLLPVEEVHDALILAESALLDCGILLTSDGHLRGIDHQALTLALRRFDLAAPVIATPCELVRKFFR